MKRRFHNIYKLNSDLRTNWQLNNFFLGSYKNSNRKIEPELMNIIQWNKHINGLISSSNDTKLSEDLSILDPRLLARSLSIYEVSNKEAIDFISMSRLVKKESVLIQVLIRFLGPSYSNENECIRLLRFSEITHQVL